MRLPTGEVEIATADELERAFRCGLADARTPIRSVGSRVWTTLAEAAQIDTCDERSLGSLLPTSIDEPAPDLPDRAPWRARTDGDVRPRRTRARTLTLVGAIGVVACSVFAVAASTRMRDGASSAGVLALEPRAAIASPSAAVSSVEPKPVPGHDLLHTPALSAEERLTKAQIRRLRELDAERRERRKVELADPARAKRRTRSGMLLTPPRGAPPSNGPFTNSGNRMDPLDGTL